MRDARYGQEERERRAFPISIPVNQSVRKDNTAPHMQSETNFITLIVQFINMKLLRVKPRG